MSRATDSERELMEALGRIVCPDCEHELRLHVSDGYCEQELGDRQVQDVGAVAMGPCGCKGILLSDDLKNCLVVLSRLARVPVDGGQGPGEV